MALTKFDMEEVLQIKYCGETVFDQGALKDELATEAESGKVRDTILEFTDSMVMYSMEIGIMVQYLKTFPNTGKKLHLITSEYVCQMLTTMNIHKIPGLLLYTSLEAVKEKFPNIDLRSID